MTVASSDFGDKAFLESAPGTGDVSDLYAAASGNRLYTGDPQDRSEAAAFAVLPFVAGGIKYLRQVDPAIFRGMPQSVAKLISEGKYGRIDATEGLEHSFGKHGPQ